MKYDERMLIGTAILGGDSHLSVNVSPADFADPKLGAMWKRMMEMREIDIATVESEFSESRNLISEIVCATPAMANINKIADRIIVAAHKRRVMESLKRAYRVLEGGGDVAVANNIVNKAADGVSVGDGWVSMADGMKGAWQKVCDAMESGEDINFIKSGFPTFDKRFGGLQKNGLIIISGRPGSGKSSLAAIMARKSGRKGPALICTFEMDVIQLSLRYFGMEAKVDMAKASRGQLNSVERSNLARCVSTLGESGLWMNDKSARSVDDIVAEARRFKRVHKKIGMLVVDHMGLIDSRGDSKIDQIEYATRNFKMLAGELDCPVLLLVQMNRNVESRSNRKPQMSDLRGCGSIEADADQIIFPTIDEDEKKHVKFSGLDDEPDQKAEGNACLYVEKNRNGNVGEMRSIWTGAFTLYEDLYGGSDEDF